MFTWNAVRASCVLLRAILKGETVPAEVVVREVETILDTEAEVQALGGALRDGDAHVDGPDTLQGNEAADGVLTEGAKVRPAEEH